MPFYYTPLIILPLLSFLTNGALAFYVWKRRYVPAASWLFWLMVALSTWSLSFTIKTVATHLWLKDICYVIGVSSINVTMFCVIPMLLETNSRKPVSRRLIYLLGIMPVCNIIMTWSNSWHRLVLQDSWLVTSSGLILHGVQEGSYFRLIYLPYTYAYYLTVIFLCMALILQRAQKKRISILLIMVATTSPLLVDMFKPSTIQWFSFTTSMLFLAGLCYWLAVFRGRMLDLAPIARGKLFEQMSEPVLVLDQEGRLAECNQAAETKLSLSTLQLGKEIDTLFPSGHPLHGIHHTRQETTLHDAGQNLWWQTSSSDLFQGKTIVGQLLILHDVTHIKEVEETALANEERFRRLSEESADVVWQLDTDFNFTYLNAADQKLRGFATEEVVGTSCLDAVPQEDAELILRANANRLEQEQQGIKTGALRYEVQMVCKDASYIWVEVHASPLRDSRGTITGYIGITRDISSRKRDEHHKDELLDDQTRFLEMISHEYRTPLAIIQANIDLMDLQESNPDRINEPRLETMRYAVGRLKEIMDLSLQKTRLLDPELGETNEPVALIPFLDSIIDTAEGLWPDRIFIFQPDELSITVKGNSAHLKTALLNLLDNGCKYSPVNTPITILVSADQAWATISIIDQGQGIPRHEADLLFEKFKRGGNSHGTSGAGLGLWLVRQIVEQHGGNVTLTSAPQAGTTLLLKLPLVV